MVSRRGHVVGRVRMMGRGCDVQRGLGEDWLFGVVVAGEVRRLDSRRERATRNGRVHVVTGDQAGEASHSHQLDIYSL